MKDVDWIHMAWGRGKWQALVNMVINVEIKRQLDATDDIYCRFYCMLNMFRAILCPSSGAREYYTDGRCLWYLVLQRHSYTAPTTPDIPYSSIYNARHLMSKTQLLPNLQIIFPSLQHQIPQAATICIILSSS